MIRGVLRRTIFGVFSLAIFFYALLWLASAPESSLVYGVSFSPAYATSLGLDWRDTYRAILTELQPPIIRIAAPWSDIENVRGAYELYDIDWMMNEAATHGARVLLVVGQKVPRWPECYYPPWADTRNTDTRMAFFAYLETVVNRYRSHEALAAWQVENEPFIRFPFGECTKFQEGWVEDEIRLVRQLDPQKNIVVTDSGELGFWWKAAQAGDVLGATVYRFVKTPSGKYWTYGWLPAGWYRVRARIFGKDEHEFIISELQAEPWFSAAGSADTATAGSSNGFSPHRFKSHLEYARHTGASQAYLWGVEWWYFMKQKQDPRYWDEARTLFAH